MLCPFSRAMHHDETVWKDPEVFNPDRHFESKLDPFTYNFGFGRR
jgi:cytochrome P450